MMNMVSRANGAASFTAWGKAQGVTQIPISSAESAIRMGSDLSRAFSAHQINHSSPGALPQAKHDTAPLALHHSSDEKICGK